MKRIPAIKSVMTPFPYAIDINTTIDAAQKFLLEHMIHHLPVTDKDGLAGVVTGRDIRIYLGNNSDSSKGTKTTVREIYIENPYIVDLNERLDAVLKAMATRHIGSALVTRHGKLAGVFTTSDACRSFAEYLQMPFQPPDGSDAA